MYIERPGNAILPVDEYGRLGSLSSELPENTFIRRIIVLAAKVYRYAYVHKSKPKEIIGEILKSKGMQLFFTKTHFAYNSDFRHRCKGGNW